jgi:hypothetical protein
LGGEVIDDRDLGLFERHLLRLGDCATQMGDQGCPVNIDPLRMTDGGESGVPAFGVMCNSGSCHCGPPAGAVGGIEFTQAPLDGRWVAGWQLSASHRSQPVKICSIGGDGRCASEKG